MVFVQIKITASYLSPFKHIWARPTTFSPNDLIHSRLKQALPIQKKLEFFLVSDTPELFIYANVQRHNLIILITSAVYMR